MTQESRRSSSSMNGQGGVQPSTSKARPRAGAAGGVGERDGERAGVHGRRVPDHHRAGEVERVEVRLALPRPGPGRGRPGAGDPRPREGHQVAADPTAQVDDGLGRGRVSRAARCVATGSRVACSRPSGVKYIRDASSPNLSSALRRSSTWVSAAATCSGEAVRRRAVCAASSITGRSSKAGQQPLPVVGEQPPERLEIQPADPSSGPRTATVASYTRSPTWKEGARDRRLIRDPFAGRLRRLRNPPDCRRRSSPNGRASAATQ